MKLGSVSSLPADRTGRIIALGITVAVPLALWFGLGAPLIGWHAQRAASLSQRRELLRHMEQLVGTIPELQRQAAQAQSDDRADSLLAGDSDAIAGAGVQEKVQAIADAAGATISSAEMLPSQQLSDYRRIALRVSVYARAWRGVPADYDRWAFGEGCAGWSFNDICHCFLRMEDNDMLASPFHGKGGPLCVSSRSRIGLRVCSWKLASKPASRVPMISMAIGKKERACIRPTTRNGRRCSAARGYLAPASQRPNLTIATQSRVRRILIERQRAVGVEYEQYGQRYQARVACELIVAAGAIGLPWLLLLSGVGPADHLREVGLEVVHDLPGVGQNLQDHYSVGLVYELAGRYGFDRYRPRHWKALAALQYLLLRRGVATSNLVEGGAFLRVHPYSEIPDVQLHFIAGADVPEGLPPVPSRNGSMLSAYALRPRSRGTLRLRSADPRDPPAIAPSFLADPEDVRTTLAATEKMREIMRERAFYPFIKREHVPELDEPLEAFVRKAGQSAFHPCGGCKMGVDALAVVDPELRVQGIVGLRVCDSSVIPSLVGSNINAPTIMIAERASEFLRGISPLASTRAMVDLATASQPHVRP